MKEADQGPENAPQASPEDQGQAQRHERQTHPEPLTNRTAVSSHGVGGSVDRQKSHLLQHANREVLRKILPQKIHIHSILVFLSSGAG